MKIQKENNQQKNHSSIIFSYLFLCVSISVYSVFLYVSPEKSINALSASKNIFISIIPILVFVIFLMGISNLLLKPKKVSKYLGKNSGVKGWLLSAIFGILSHGPIYVWYPLLKDLNNQGMRTGLVAVFLYNRAIKIPLVPIMVFYFGIYFVGILCLYMIVASLCQGKIIDILEEHRSLKQRTKKI